MSHPRRVHAMLATGLALLLVGPVSASTPSATPTSSRSTGEQGDDPSGQPAISADGRFVAFMSWASNLVPDDTNGWGDVFVRDRQSGRTERISVSDAGNEGDMLSEHPTISADGRFVAFASDATNLVAKDTNDETDIFVHDRKTDTTERVSVTDAGKQGNSGSYSGMISADGRFVAFDSDATNLVADDPNGSQGDIFVHDRTKGTTRVVSVSSRGALGNDSSWDPSISADGRFVAFDSDATNLVADDTNGVTDTFVHDRSTGTTERVSVSDGGEQGNGYSRLWSISADGNFVTFASDATNLGSGDRIGLGEVFVHDRTTARTERVGSEEVEPGKVYFWPSSMSADGRLVAFRAPGNVIVVHDRETGTTTRIGGSGAGEEDDDWPVAPSISADGRYLAFSSDAVDLVAGDTNHVGDVFVRDLSTGTAERVSLSSAGKPGDDNHIASPEAGSFIPAGALGRKRYGQTATALPDGRVLVVGGTDELYEYTVAAAEIWDPVTMTFGPAGSLAQGRSAHTATALPDGRVLVVGGVDYELAQHTVPAAEIWDPVTMSFGPAGSLGHWRHGHTATALPDGRVLVVGGIDDEREDHAVVAAAEIWDPETMSFHPAGEMRQGRQCHTATALPDSRVLIVGGRGNRNDDGRTPGAAEIWDPVTVSFGPAGSLRWARMGHVAALLPGDRVIVFGGWTGSSGSRTTAEVWDPATSTFDRAGKFVLTSGDCDEATFDHVSVTTLPDGRFLVVGGADAQEDTLATAAVWDVTTMSSAPAGSMPDVRSGHTATALADGRVLIVGGLDSDAELLTTAELWQPTGTD